MDTEIIVEKNVPIPTERPSKYPFATMEVGDSFVRPAATKQLVRTHALTYKRNHPGWDYLTKTTPEGIRLWRTA